MSSDTTSKALKGVHSQTAVVAIKGVLALVYFSIMSRLLTPEDFGFFALITAVTTILCSLSEAGLGSAVIQRKNATPDFVSTAFTLSLILGIVFSCVLFCGAPLFSKLTTGSDILELAYKLMSLIILLQSVNNITWSLYMRKLDFFKFGILQIGADFLSYITGIVLAIRGVGYYAIVGAVISNQVFLTIILVILKKYHFKLMIVKSMVRDIIGYGGWLTAAVITRNFTDEVDKIIIGRILPIVDLGAMNRPQGFIARISTQVNSVVDTVLFPILSSIQDDREKITRGYLKIVSLVVTFSAFLGCLFSLGSKLVIDIFFGSQWEHLQPILIVFALAMIVRGYSRVADSFFRSLGIVRRYFFARLINWVIIISLVIIGCRFGILGASLGIAIGSFVSCVVKFFMQNQTVGVSIKQISKVVARSLIAPISLAVISAIFLIFPFGEYLGVVAFVMFGCVTIWFFPNIYSPVFKDIVIYRYIKRNRAFSFMFRFSLKE